MSQKPGSLTKTTLYFDTDLLGKLSAIRDQTGVSVSALIRRAVASKVAERAAEPEDFSDIAVVRRALLNGGSWTTSADEMGTNIDGVWSDPLTGQSVHVTAIIECGKPRHSSATVGLSLYSASEALSKPELAAANKSLRTAYKASRAGKRDAGK